MRLFVPPPSPEGRGKAHGAREALRLPWRARSAARRTRNVLRAVLVACGTAVALWNAGAHAQARDPERGAARSAACNECHGTPERPPLPGVPVLAGQQREFLVLQMFYLREGLREVPQMTGLFKGWTDRDLEDVGAHYARLAPPPLAQRGDAALLAQGAGLSKAMACGSCHLPDYRGQKHVPRLSPQREDYLVAALTAYRDNKRTGTDTSMNAVMYQVTDAEIRALAHYLAQR